MAIKTLTRAQATVRRVVALAVLGAGLTVGTGPLSVAHAAGFLVNSHADAGDARPGDGICATSIFFPRICTLRAAIQEANAHPGSDIITLPAGVYALTLGGANEDAAASGDLDITEPDPGGPGLVIQGAGAETTIVSGGALDRVIDIRPGAVATLSGLTIQKGSAPDGGGLRDDGTVTLNNSTVTANTATRSGGGIVSDGNLAVLNSTIFGNGAAYGGGISTSASMSVLSVSCGSNGCRKKALNELAWTHAGEL
jgi:CSLREA domain-containing protein